MFVVFVGALTVFLIIGMFLAWVGNKKLLICFMRFIVSFTKNAEIGTLRFG